MMMSIAKDFITTIRAGWVNGAGIKIQDWKLLFKNWVKKDQLKEQEKAKPQKSKIDMVFDKFMEEDDD